MSQEMLVAAFNTINRVAATPSKNEKQVIFQAGDSPYLRKLLWMTYNKFRTYRLQQIDMPEKYNVVTPDVMGEFEILLNTLASHTVGSLQAKSRVKAFLGLCTQEHAQILANVITRDLRMGCDEKTINKAFPALIPVFGVQSAKHLDDWSRVKFPCLVEEKMDGIRLVGVYDGEVTRFYSKGGFEMEGFAAFAKEVESLAPGFPFVLDGEFKAFKFNPLDKTCVKHKNGNWEFEYAKSIVKRKDIDPAEIKEFFKLHVWDVINYDYFTSQGVKGNRNNRTTEQRKINLCALFNRSEKPLENLELLPNRIMHTKEEITGYMQELKVQRKEGLMIKPLDAFYTFSKNFNVIKLKHFVEADFRILDAYEGKAGKKYEGMLGGVTIGTDDGKLKTNMGSGFSADECAELWVEHLSGRLVGKIIEVQFKDITADNSLQLPTLIRFREDKDTTDTLEEIKAKLHIVEEED